MNFCDYNFVSQVIYFFYTNSFNFDFISHAFYVILANLNLVFCYKFLQFGINSSNSHFLTGFRVILEILTMLTYF